MKSSVRFAALTAFAFLAATAARAGMKPCPPNTARDSQGNCVTHASGHSTGHGSSAGVLGSSHGSTGSGSAATGSSNRGGTAGGTTSHSSSGSTGHGSSSGSASSSGGGSSGSGGSGSSFGHELTCPKGFQKNPMGRCVKLASSNTSN